MEKEFIPFQEALILKEMGFVELCLMVGYKHGGSVYNRIGNEGEAMYQTDKKEGKDYAAALPTYSQAFRWFRNEHKIDVTIDNWSEQPVNDEIWPKAYQYYINGEAFHPYFQTYEEAELECLRKLIETVKK